MPWLGVGLIVLGLALIPPVRSLWRAAMKGRSLLNADRARQFCQQSA